MMKVIISFLMLCSVVLADRDGGPYLGVGYGFSMYSDDGLYNNLEEDTSAALTLYAGAYINKHLSVELGYVSFDAKNSADGYVIDANKSLGFGVITVSTLAHYAFFDDTLDTYARFGVGEMSLSGLEKSGFTMQYGLGVGLRINEILSFKIAYDLYKFKFDYINNETNTVGYKMEIDYIYSALEVQF